MSNEQLREQIDRMLDGDQHGATALADLQPEISAGVAAAVRSELGEQLPSRYSMDSSE